MDPHLARLRASPVQLNSNQLLGKKRISLNNIPIDDSEYDSECFGIERPNLYDKANNTNKIAPKFKVPNTKYSHFNVS